MSGEFFDDNGVTCQGCGAYENRSTLLGQRLGLSWDRRHAGCSAAAAALPDLLGALGRAVDRARAERRLPPAEDVTT